MSNIINDIPEVKAMGTENTEEYGQLQAEHLKREFLKNTPQIIAALSNEEENRTPYEVVTEELSNGCGVFVEQGGEILRAHIMVKETMEEKSFLDMTANPNSSDLQIISGTTFDQLCTLAITPEEAFANVKTKLQNAI